MAVAAPPIYDIPALGPNQFPIKQKTAWQSTRPISKRHSTSAELLSQLVTAHQALDSSISGITSSITDPVTYLSSPALISRWKSDVNTLFESSETTSLDSTTISDPMSYLTSPTLIARWNTDLDSLFGSYLRGDLTPDIFGKRLQVILPGVEKLEKARDMMERDGKVDELWEAVNGRCRILEEVFDGLEHTLQERDRMC